MFLQRETISQDHNKIYNDFVLFHFKYTRTNFKMYFVGINFGKSPLLKSVSPKKTIEGFVGGLTMSIIFSILFYKVVDLNFNLIQANKGLPLLRTLNLGPEFWLGTWGIPLLIYNDVAQRPLPA